jgi:hypothetical protein
MARDRKASFKFTSRTASLPRLLSTATSDALGTTITYSGTSVAYASVSDVFRTINMVRADAQDFGTQVETASSGSSDLVGINAQNQDLFVKVIVTNNGSVANLGTPQLQVFASATNSTDASSFKLDSSPVEVSAAVNVTTTASGSAMYFIPFMTSKPYIQLQLNGTSSGAAAGTLTITMAAIVNGRDGSVSL